MTDDAETRARRSTIEDFKLRVAEFRTRLAALEKELGINLEHEDSHGAFMYFDARDGYPQFWASETGALYLRETAKSPLQGFYSNKDLEAYLSALPSNHDR